MTSDISDSTPPAPKEIQPKSQIVNNSSIFEHLIVHCRRRCPALASWIYLIVWLKGFLIFAVWSSSCPSSCSFLLFVSANHLIVIALQRNWWSVINWWMLPEWACPDIGFRFILATTAPKPRNWDRSFYSFSLPLLLILCIISPTLRFGLVISVPDWKQSDFWTRSVGVISRPLLFRMMSNSPTFSFRAHFCTGI